MTADYYLNVYDTAGVRQFVITDFTSLSYLKKVNAPGLVQFSLRGDHPLLSAIGDKWQVEVWRRPGAGGSFGRDFVGLFRMGEFYYGAQGSKAVLTCPGLMSMLAWRTVAWPAGSANRSAFVAAPGETIMKMLVQYNAGAGATIANGRLADGALSGLLVEADAGAGNVQDWYCAEDALLGTLQKLAAVAGGDFNLVKTGSTSYQFIWRSGQLGVDRMADVVFALQYGNMANPEYKLILMEEKSVCIVGGNGECSERNFVVRTGPNYNSGNHIEMFLNASGAGSDSADYLATRGDAALAENRAKEQFSFDVLQTSGTAYGVHYDVGDRVTAINPFTRVAMPVKIDETLVSVNEKGEEKIDVRMQYAG